MRIAGHNVFAILVAAIAMYFAEFLIYGVLVPPETYKGLARLADEDMSTQGWKMPFGLIGPLIWAIGLSVALGWRGGASGWKHGATTGVITGALFMVAARFYTWAYGDTGLAFYALDAAHFVGVGALGGAVIGAWPGKKA